MIPMTHILIHSINGYLFVVPMLLLYVLYGKRIGKKQTIWHIITVFLFCYYIVVIYTTTGIKAFGTFAPRIAQTPFSDMIHGTLETILNIILFLPLGFFLPVLYPNYRRMPRVVCVGCLLSLCIETSQMFGMGITALNDILTNTVGTYLGFCPYRLFARYTKKWNAVLQSVSAHAYAESLCFIIYPFLVMISVQPRLLSMLYH